MPLLDRIDGRSLMPLLRGQTTTHRQDQLIVHSQFRCLRTERYKFIDNLIERHELYDLANDPREQVNIFDTADPTLREALNHRLYQRILDRGYVW